MGVLTIEGIVNNGQVILPSDVHLPEHLKVYVVVLDMKVEQTVHLFNPHLKNPNQVVEFEMEISKESTGDGL